MSHKQNWSYFYILILQSENAIKVGKSNNLHRRIGELSADWGEVDYSASYTLFAATDIVFKIEKNVKNFISSFQTKVEEDKIGKTEVFSSGALEPALECLKLYLSLHPEFGSLTLKKSIMKPRRNIKVVTTSPLYEKVEKESKKYFEQIDDCIVKFKRIHHLIAFLIRYQSRIPFQYDIGEDRLFFRVWNTKSKKSKILCKTKSLRSMFDFNIEGFCCDGKYWQQSVGCFRHIRTDDFIEYEIQLLPVEENPILYNMGMQALKALQKLPTKSEALVGEIQRTGGRAAG